MSLPDGPAALVVMVKEPVPGQVKTRLTPLLTPEEAAALYTAFLQDIGRELTAWDGPLDRWVAWAGDGDAPSETLQDAFPGCRFVRQEGGTLSARMEAVFDALFADGYRVVVMRNSDSPHLDPDVPREAAASLRSHDVVLGPDLDGGYYLVGLRAPPDGLFPPVLSHGGVLDQTCRAAAARGWSVAQLAPFPDVDTPEDLAVFGYELGARADARRWATVAVLDGLDLAARLERLA